MVFVDRLTSCIKIKMTLWVTVEWFIVLPASYVACTVFMTRNELSMCLLWWCLNVVHSAFMCILLYYTDTVPYCWRCWICAAATQWMITSILASLSGLGIQAVVWSHQEQRKVVSLNSNSRCEGNEAYSLFWVNWRENQIHRRIRSPLFPPLPGWLCTLNWSVN